MVPGESPGRVVVLCPVKQSLCVLHSPVSNVCERERCAPGMVPEENSGLTASMSMKQTGAHFELVLMEQ